MASADTLCKKLLGVRSAVVTGHDFYQDSDGLNHLRIHARPSKRHENDWPTPLSERAADISVVEQEQRNPALSRILCAYFVNTVI